MLDKSPDTLIDLKAAITDEYSRLSKRLRQVAAYLLDNPNEIAFGTVAVIAKDAGVHPSTLVRFANAFGYSGFSEMQRLFQRKLILESPNYKERIRIARAEMGDNGCDQPIQFLDEYVSANTAALEHLRSSISPEDLDRAVDILARAETTHIVGVRRAFVVASYFSYMLRHMDRKAYLIDGVGGMYAEQASALTSQDALIAVSFHPYASETQNVAKTAMEKEVPLVVITDSQVSPLAEFASVCLVVKEAEVHAFRSLSSSVCLAQSISVSLAYRLEQQKS